MSFNRVTKIIIIEVALDFVDASRNYIPNEGPVAVEEDVMGGITPFNTKLAAKSSD